MPAAILLLGGAAAAGAVALKSGKGSTTAQAGVAKAIDQNPNLGYGSQKGATIAQLQSQAAPAPHTIPTHLSLVARGLIRGTTQPLTTARSAVALPGIKLPTTQSNVASGDPAIQQKLDEINKYAGAVYDNMSADAKQAGARALNQALNLDPPLKGDETWQTISSVAGGALGGAVGGYLGGPYGAKIGAMIGAYLGVKLEEVISEDADKIGDWFKSKWGDVETWVSNEANSLYSDAQQAYNDASNAVSGAVSDASDAASSAYDDTANYLGGLF